MSKIKICLDAGHYGKYNQSPVVKTFYEAEMNWKLHLKLKAELEQYGIEVITTRADQAKDLSLDGRGNAARGCNLFLSIHANATDNADVDYPLVIVPVNKSADEIGKRIAKCIQSTMETKQACNLWSKKNDRGYDWYGVIRAAVAAGVPGLILEHSFYTNVRSANWLLDEGNLDKLAAAEAATIADYYGLQKQAPVVVKTYEVVTKLPFYSNAGDAKAKKNVKGYYAAGTYYIYNKYPNGYNGMLNIGNDKTGKTAGSWINPAENAVVIKETVEVEKPAQVEEVKQPQEVPETPTPEVQETLIPEVAVPEAPEVQETPEVKVEVEPAPPIDKPEAAEPERSETEEVEQEEKIDPARVNFIMDLLEKVLKAILGFFGKK